MRKQFFVLSFFIILLCLSGCGNKKEAPDQTDDNNTSFSIIYELGELKNVFIEAPVNAIAGSKVELKTGVWYDADLHIFINGQEIEKIHNDSDYWGYTFTMPEKDVTVTVTPYTKDEMFGGDN